MYPNSPVANPYTPVSAPSEANVVPPPPYLQTTAPQTGIEESINITPPVISQPPIPNSQVVTNNSDQTTAPLTVPPEAPTPASPIDLLTESPPTEETPTNSIDTSLETVAANLTSAAALETDTTEPGPTTVQPPEVSEVAADQAPTSEPVAPPAPKLQDLLLDVMRDIEAGQDSAATMGITELVKNGYTQEALQLYQALTLNRSLTHKT